MPGLSGRVGGHARDDAERVARRLQHLPFYDNAVVGDDSAWLAWVGIGDPARHVLKDEAAGVLAAYHGDGVEGFPATEAAARLEKVGRLADSSPLELAEALDGTFVAGRYDIARRELTLVTDPFGHHRLYYLQRGDTLHFAPELKGLLVRDGLDLRPDALGLRHYVNYAYPLGDITSLADVRLLPPASVLRYRDGELQVETYWRPLYEPVEGEDGELAEQGYELFARAFAGKVAPGRRVVVPVSGGLDSRLLLAEARRRDHPIVSYTYGHAASREAGVALELMTACDAGDRFIVQDDMPDPVDALLQTSWLAEGMVNTSIMSLVGVNQQLMDEPRDAVFLNGIYGGPTNFSSGYHRPEELTDTMPLQEKVGRILFTMTGRRGGLREDPLLAADHARTCAAARGPDLQVVFEPWQDVSPLYGHQKDAFFIANRMCRFINQVDLNRYYWDSVVPMTSFSLYRFYLRLPDRLKFGRLLHRQILVREFPEVAGVVNFNSGRTVMEELAGTPPVVRSRWPARFRHLAGRISRGRLARPDPDSYQAPDHLLRSNRALCDFVGDLLNDPGFLAGDVFDRRAVRNYFDKNRRGADLGRAIHSVVSWELWLRQIAAGRREVA